MTARKSGTWPAPIHFDDLKGAWILGARGKAPGRDRTLAAVAAVERRFKVRVTVVDARAVCGAAHLASAVHHARSAAAAGEARARDPQVEVMLYLSGQRQITHALERAGVGPSTRAMALVVEGPAATSSAAAQDLMERLGMARDDAVMRPSREKLQRLLGHAPPAGTTDFEALALESTAMLRLESS